VFTEITPFKVVLEDAFSTEVRLNELLHASVQRMDLEAAKHAIIMGADVKLQPQKSWKGQRRGYEMDVDDVDVSSVTWNWTAELIYIYMFV